jgi:polar amino acid transport system substrate-binding protein
MRKMTLTALGLMAAGALAAGPAQAAPPANLGLLKDGEISVGSDIPYAPFEFFRRGTKEVIGFDVDLVRAAAATFGIRNVRFVDATFDTILLQLAQRRFDMVASSVTITPQRARQVLFSSPYFSANQSITVRTGTDITRPQQLRGVRVGAQRGTTGADTARRLGAQVQLYEEIDDAFTALAGRRVEAVVNDFAISAYAARNRPGLTVTAQIVTNESYGLAFNRRSSALRGAFNQGIARIKANGTYARIYRKWFGTAPPS